MAMNTQPPHPIAPEARIPGLSQADHYREDLPTSQSFETFDRVGRALSARLTQGISPHALYAAWFDWASHLANAPGRLLELWGLAANTNARLARFAAQSLSETVEPPFRPEPSDRRFANETWHQVPYLLWQQAFLAAESWWTEATREVRGMTPKNAARVGFMAHQMLDVWSPSNFPWLNPTIIDRTQKETGANLVRGALNLSLIHI